MNDVNMYKMWEALIEIKYDCEEFSKGGCEGCPCLVNDECQIMENMPSTWLLKKREVFFG